MSTAQYSTEYKSREVSLWINRVYKEWSKIIAAKPLAERASDKGKEEIVHYNQTKKFLKPFLKKIEALEAPPAILDRIFEIMIFCMDGDYFRAQEKYFDLSIGNAPWPLGVQMAGLHERSYFTKNYCTMEPHIYKEESVRKYLIAVKRIVNFFERYRPKIDFN